MPRQKRAKARYFIVQCERNDAYESELKLGRVAHEYHGFDFFVPMELDMHTVTDHITNCLKKYHYSLISITCTRIFKALTHNIWGLDEIERSIKFGYHR